MPPIRWGDAAHDEVKAIFSEQQVVNSRRRAPPPRGKIRKAGGEEQQAAHGLQLRREVDVQARARTGA